MESKQSDIHNKKKDKYWKKTDIDASLRDNLNQYTKVELGVIAKNLEIKKISSLKKGEMIEKINELYKEKVNFLIEDLSVDEVELLYEIDHLDRVKKIEDITVYDYDYLRYRGLVFTGKIDKDFVVTIPKELSFLFKERLEDKGKVISLLVGMCYYYGVIIINDFFEMLPKYIDFDLTLDQCKKIIGGFVSKHNDIKVEDNLIIYKYVDDSGVIFKEQNKRPELNYYEFTKKELLNVNESDFEKNRIEKTEFFQYIRKKYGIEEGQAIDVMLTLEKLTKNGEVYVKIVEGFIKHFKIKDESEVKIIIGKINVLINNSRQWILKGHKPKEVNKQKKVIGTEKKVGRNDPCPCGSGKKYKRCCG